MISTRLRLLGLCVTVFGMMAIMASAAQAALFEWVQLTNGVKELIGTKVVVEAEKESADLTLLTKLLGKKFAITCTNFTVSGISVEPEGKLTTGGKVVFTGCEAYGKGSLEEALGCHVHSAGKTAGTIESNKGKGELVLHEGKIVTKISPEVGTTFGTFLTEECVLPESNPVNGTLYVKDCEGNSEVHLKKHLIEELVALTQLWVGSDTAEHLETSIDGSAWVFLQNEKLWAAEHNV
jgi:hypothetical protein